MFGVSALATVSVEEIASLIDTPKMFQFYFHKDRGLNDSCLERAKAAKFDVLALTVDTITGGNRERDLRLVLHLLLNLHYQVCIVLLQNQCGE